jgi:hypothetical protein
MSHTLLQPVSLTRAFQWPVLGVGRGARFAWRWLMDEKQMASESFYAEDVHDAQWQDTQTMAFEVDIPVERYGAR